MLRVTRQNAPALIRKSMRRLQSNVSEMIAAANNQLPLRGPANAVALPNADGASAVVLSRTMTPKESGRFRIRGYIGVTNTENVVHEVTVNVENVAGVALYTPDPIELPALAAAAADIPFDGELPIDITTPAYPLGVPVTFLITAFADVANKVNASQNGSFLVVEELFEG